jgi:hypothetical protein
MPDGETGRLLPKKVPRFNDRSGLAPINESAVPLKLEARSPAATHSEISDAPSGNGLWPSRKEIQECLVQRKQRLMVFLQHSVKS